MFDFIGNCILWVLALYGLMDIIKIIKNCIVHRRIESNGVYVIVAAKNQEHQIESFFRSVVFKILYGKEDFIRNIIVTDLNSVDNTRSILEKFSEDYGEIKYVEWDECKKELDNLE